MEIITEHPMAQVPASAFTSAFNTYSRKLFGFIRKRVKSIEDAEDILQDVWLQFISIAELDEIGNISGWLYRVTRNKLTDRYRKKKPENLSDMEFADDDDGISFKEILLLDTENNPELALFKEVFWKELLSALDELPENQKLVFIQNEMEGITLREIAEKSGENLKTIISRKSYSVKYLRSKLAYLYNEL